MTISGDGSKAEDYESIARLDYARFLESLPEAFYQQLDANQLEVQPIWEKILRNWQPSSRHGSKKE